MCTITWGKSWKDYRHHCHTRPVLTQPIILILSQNSLKFVRIMGFLMILWGIGWKILLDLSALCSLAWWLYWPRLNDQVDHRRLSGFTDVGLYKISESVRASAYLILSSQASARPSIIANTTSILTKQSAFLNNFENIVNCRVDIREDIKHYQDTLSYASSKVDYSMGENLYMLPSDMNLKIRSGTARLNNKILVSNGNFSLGKMLRLT